MKAMLISAITALGALVATTATSGCLWIFIDEPEAPKSMLEK